MAMKFALIPHSRATNSYELLEDVVKVIDEEPKRFDWATWFDDTDRMESKTPACGTFACVAGWVNLLTAAKRKTDYTGVPAEQWFPTGTVLRGDLASLFYASFENPATEHVPFDNYMVRGRNETQREYADRGIRSVRAFMAKHEAALKAHAIVIPERDVNPMSEKGLEDGYGHGV